MGLTKSFFNRGRVPAQVDYGGNHHLLSMNQVKDANGKLPDQYAPKLPMRFPVTQRRALHGLKGGIHTHQKAVSDSWLLTLVPQGN